MYDWNAVPQDLIDELPERQRAYILGIRSGETVRHISEQEGASERTVYRQLAQAKKTVAKAGWTPTFDATRFVDPGQQIKGKSTFAKDDEGNPVWIKTEHSKEREGLSKFAESLAESIKPARKVTPTKTPKAPDLMTAIFIGDAHTGLYAYGKETRHSDFDSDIAAEQILAAIDDLISRAPDSETGLLVDVGDFMHADTSHNKTFAGTDVDVDTRFERVLEVAGVIMQHAIQKMLKKFNKVIVVIAKGNHNPTSAVSVQKITKAYYRNEPRVTVLDTIGYFHYIEWGKWLIGVNHGDKIKPQKLVSVMARDMAQAWGRTNSRMWALGHFHHQQTLELEGCIVQKFGALPPPDSWHAGMGFGSSQVMEMITFKKDGGKHSTMIYEIPPVEREPDLVIE